MRIANERQWSSFLVGSRVPSRKLHIGCLSLYPLMLAAWQSCTHVLALYIWSPNWFINAQFLSYFDSTRINTEKGLRSKAQFDVDAVSTSALGPLIWLRVKTDCSISCNPHKLTRSGINTWGDITQSLPDYTVPYFAIHLPTLIPSDLEPCQTVLMPHPLRLVCVSSPSVNQPGYDDVAADDHPL